MQRVRCVQVYCFLSKTSGKDQVFDFELLVPEAHVRENVMPKIYDRRGKKCIQFFPTCLLSKKWNSFSSCFSWVRPRMISNGPKRMLGTSEEWIKPYKKAVWIWRWKKGTIRTVWISVNTPCCLMWLLEFAFKKITQQRANEVNQLFATWNRVFPHISRLRHIKLATIF